MWLLAMFDLPTDTKKARKDYTEFRKSLIKDGFMMLQYSVYGRFCPSQEVADVHERQIRSALPPDGEVRILRITDKQFEQMEIYWGKMRKPSEQSPRQLEFF